MSWPLRRRPPALDPVQQAVNLDRAEQIVGRLEVATAEMRVALLALQNDRANRGDNRAR